MALTRVAHAADTSVPIAERIAALLGDLLSGEKSGLAIAVAWVGGVLTAFTPCVYPLYPITVRYFAGGKPEQSSTGKVVSYAAVYVLGMTLLYAALGTSFAALGVVFGRALGSPWVTGTMALVSFAMAVSLLGAFNIQLPSSVASKLGLLGSRTYHGALAMGLVSGLIAAPCTGPVLAVILTLIAKNGAIGFGFALMVAFGFGVGTPLLVIAASAHHLSRLPKSGPWMTAIKAALASAMILVAAYFGALASRDVAHVLAMLPAWSGQVAGGLGIVLFVLLVMRKIPESAGQVGAVAGLSLGLITAALGGGHAATAIVWTSSHEDAISRAREGGKAVMIDFTAEWCTGCKELDAQTFPDPRIAAEAERFVAAKLDATEPDAAMNDLFARYGILGLPTVIFIDSTGKVLETPRVTGFTPPDRFLALMQQVR
ncbi:MAG: protein-disulfide reductase DsbD family protein [Myxococcota bacterium]|nr:cytochrome c biogenesis protein CcdA [Myxococcota bacterium]